MTLTDQHVRWIRKSITNRGITSIDLEFEMVDHISAATEEYMNKGLTFKEAFKKVMITFGPYGMEKLQRKKTRQLHKNGWRLLWKELKLFFGWPKIAFTALLFVSSYYLMSIIQPTEEITEMVMIATNLLSLPLIIYFLTKSWKTKYEELRQITWVYYLGAVYPVVYMPQYLKLITNVDMVWVYSIFVTLMVMLHVSCLAIMKRVREEVEMKYQMAA